MKLNKTLAMNIVAEKQFGLTKEEVEKYAQSFPDNFPLDLIRGYNSLKVCSNVKFCLDNCEYAESCKEEGNEILDDKKSTTEKKKWGTFLVKCGTTIMKDSSEEK